MKFEIKYRVMKGPLTKKTIEAKDEKSAMRKLYETIGSKYLRDVKVVQV